VDRSDGNGYSQQQRSVSIYLPSLTVLIPGCSTKNMLRVGIMGLPRRVAKTALTQKTTNIAAGGIIHGRIAT
jgi:hypothetical protein